MASNCRVVISFTPIAEGTISEGSGSNVKEIAGDIGTTLGGSYSIDVEHINHINSSYAGTDGTRTYINCIAGAYTLLGSNNTAYDFIYIKHMGSVYSSDSALGNPTTDNIDVFVEKVDISPYIKFCSIPPGGVIVLPNTPALGLNLGIFVKSSGSDNIAMEYVAIT